MPPKAAPLAKLYISCEPEGRWLQNLTVQHYNTSKDS